MVALEEHVPTDHLLRKIEAAVDFEFIREKVSYDTRASARGSASMPDAGLTGAWPSTSGARNRWSAASQM